MCFPGRPFPWPLWLWSLKGLSGRRMGGKCPLALPTFKWTQESRGTSSKCRFWLWSEAGQRVCISHQLQVMPRPLVCEPRLALRYDLECNTVTLLRETIDVLWMVRRNRKQLIWLRSHSADTVHTLCSGPHTNIGSGGEASGEFHKSMPWERISSPGSWGISGRGYEHEVTQTHQSPFQPPQDRSWPLGKLGHQPGLAWGKWGTGCKIWGGAYSQGHAVLVCEASLTSVPWRLHSPSPGASPAKAGTGHALVSHFEIPSGTAARPSVPLVFLQENKIRTKWKQWRKSL